MAVIRLFTALCAAAMLVTAAFLPVGISVAAHSGAPQWTFTSMSFTADEGQLLDTARDPLTGELWVSFMVNNPPGIAVCQQADGPYGGGGWQCNGPFPIGDRGSSPSAIDVFHTEDQFRVGLVYIIQQRFMGNEIVYRSRECSLDESCLWSDPETIVRGETDEEFPEYANYRYFYAQIKFGWDGTPYVPIVVYSVVGEIEVASLAHPSQFTLSCPGNVSNWTCMHIAEALGVEAVDIDVDTENRVHLIHYGHNTWQYLKQTEHGQGNCLLGSDFDCTSLAGFPGFFSLDVPSAGEAGFPARFAFIPDGTLYLAEESPGSSCSIGLDIWDPFACTQIEAVGTNGTPFVDFTNNPYLTSDPEGRPVIVYKDYDHPAAASLKIAAPAAWWQEHGGGANSCGGGLWHCATAADGVESEVAVEIDGSGLPTVFFYDPGSRRLILARLAPSVPGAGSFRVILPLVMN